MNELIPLQPQTINGNAVETVNARELHAFLEVQTRFNDWIKNRIEQYDFVENQDFTTVTKNLENGGRSIDYYITLDMAKELSMVERNEKGKQARKYFIECEKQLNAQQSQLPTTYIEALRALADEVEAHEHAQQQLAIAGILKILTLSMANFHCSKLSSAIIPLITKKRGSPQSWGYLLHP